MGRFGIVLVFPILTITPLISESLLGNTHVTMEIFQKSLGTFSLKTSTIAIMLVFMETFNFDVHCLSCKLMSLAIQKMITDVVYFMTSA